jgi:hypothetical protein
MFLFVIMVRGLGGFGGKDIVSARFFSATGLVGFLGAMLNDLENTCLEILHDRVRPEACVAVEVCG